MQKILVTKNESVSEVVGQLMKANDSEITLVIPRGAAMSSSSENFSIIKQQAATEGIEVSVESVDDEALLYAKENGMNAVHPLFASAGMRTLSDIVPSRDSNRPAMKNAKKKAATKKSAKSIPESDKVIRKISIPMESEGVAEEATSDDDMPKMTQSEPYIYEDDDRPRSRRGRKIVAVLGLLAVLVLGGAFVVGKFFSNATVTLEFNKVPWEYNERVTVQISDASIDAEARRLPGEVFNDHRNMTNLFPASGRATVSEKASGKITIYNNFSSAAQQLVANTRFEAPDKKIVRLVKSVTVPGAKIVGGKLQPSSVEADVVADQPGADYNIGPIEKLTIPGFQGTPKYDGFYGAITNALTGGVVGERAVATTEDFDSAKERTKEMLMASLAAGALRDHPADFTIIDGASQTAIVKIGIVSSTSEIDKFAVYGEGDITAIAFRESDMKKMLTDLAQASSSGMVLKDLTISYSNPVADFTKGILVLTVDAKGTLTGDVSEQTVREDLAGKPVDEAKLKLIELPHLSRAQIKLWPFWVSVVPAKADKIKIENQ